MDPKDLSQKELAVMWIFGAVFTAVVLLGLIFWPDGAPKWPAIALAVTLPLYHVWKVRTTVKWLEEEYGVQWRLGRWQDEGT